MNRSRRCTTLRVVAVSVAVYSLGCTPVPGTGKTGLTDSEKQALQATLAAARTITSAVATLQNGAGANGFDARANPQVRTTGACPVVTTNVTATEPVELRVMLDFGAGCTPAYWPGVTCSGSVMVSVRPESGELSAAFQELTCNGASLTGTADATFSETDGVNNVSGTWDLTWSEGTSRVATEGTGVCRCDPATFVTTIPSFAGSVSDGSAAWNVQFADLMISYKTYGSHVPYSGSMTLEGQTIRTLSIRFSTASPATGDVDVSFDGTHYATINLDELYELLL